VGEYSKELESFTSELIGRNPSPGTTSGNADASSASATHATSTSSTSNALTSHSSSSAPAAVNHASLVESKTAEIARLLDKCPPLRRVMEALVPHRISYVEFWGSYFMQEREEKGLTAEDEEEVPWDSDENEVLFWRQKYDALRSQMEALRVAGADPNNKQVQPAENPQPEVTLPAHPDIPASTAATTATTTPTATAGHGTSTAIPSGGEGEGEEEEEWDWGADEDSS
jgi:hypothetical protein